MWLDMNINNIDFQKSIIEKSNINNLLTIRDIWILKRSKLKELGFNDKEIKEIIVKLQLKGYDLNRKKY